VKVGVRADGVYVEEVGHAELAEADLQTSARQFVEERKIAARAFDLILA